MAEIKLNINGNEVIGEKGDSVLVVCQKNDIRVPTLCHHDRLVDTGACRICLVEIEGQRGYRPACCTGASDGMIVKTDTDEIKRLRRTMLEFLFSERNHFCMFCEVSGDCELQNLAYEYGIEHAKYDYAQPQVRIDSSRYYFVFDENRCILCQRCIRACSEIAGHNVLDLGRRGADARIIADLNVPFGESTCTSCGTCLQVCPTGALIDRGSSYLGRMEQCEVTKSTCSFCSVGCGIEVVTRDNHVLKINGDWEKPVNKGLLCVAGRFEPLHIQKERLTKPMVKRNGTLTEVSMDEAISYIADKFNEVGKDNVMGLISSKATNEEAGAFMELLGYGKVGEFGPNIVLPDKEKKASLEDVNASDCILMYKVDLDNESRVVGSFVKLDVHKRNAKLILVDDKANHYDDHATLKLLPEVLYKAKELISQASSPVIIYSSNTNEEEVKALSALSAKAKLMGLAAGGNSRGLHNMGINGKVDVEKAKAIYILACDDDLKDKLDDYDKGFLVLQTSYYGNEIEKADVVLPSPIWAEKSGRITNMDGLVQDVAKSIEAPEVIQPNESIVNLLGDKLA